MNKSKTVLREENLLTLFSQNNFIIPEIQREYVWGNYEKVITKFLLELKNKIGGVCSHCHLPENNEKINIGFLYSYKPDYVKVRNERFLDESLIDGQQRSTTLFLLLFYFALKENRKNDFLSLVRYDKVSMCFDFKVRDLTKHFLLELVEKTDNIQDIELINQQTWFLEDYKSDLSIKAMINALKHIKNIYSCETKYYNHFLTNIFFWHFKTEATSEGEELYITMNARGEDLADNEITKAVLMLDGKDLYSSGQKWESWQDLFWKNRDKTKSNQCADYGFNSFINCISGLENYLRVAGNKFSVGEIEALLTIDKIENYIKTFEYILTNVGEYKDKYNYSDTEDNWLDSFLRKTWDMLNNNDTDWLVDYTDKNKATEQNKMIFIWSWMLYLTDLFNNDKEPNLDETFRVLRFFYIRYNNNNRAVSSLRNTITTIKNNGIFHVNSQDVSTIDSDNEVETKYDYRTKNESLKYEYFSKISNSNGNELREIERLVWEIEDHPFNLIGKDLGNINSSHLIDFKQNPDKLIVLQIKEKFYNLFPVINENKYKNAAKIRNILFSYGKYWQKKWVNYYWCFDFGNWNRIIRDLDSKDTIFNSFFNDYLDMEIEELYDRKVKDFSIDFNTENELTIFKWYASKIGETMWNQDRYLALDHYNYKSEDVYFHKINKLVNYKGNFNGGNPEILSNLVKK